MVKLLISGKSLRMSPIRGCMYKTQLCHYLPGTENVTDKIDLKFAMQQRLPVLLTTMLRIHLQKAYDSIQTTAVAGSCCGTAITTTIICFKSQKPLTTVSGDDCSRVHCQGKDTGRLSFAHVTGTAKLLARSKTDACTGEASARCFKLWTLPLHFANQLAYAA